MTATVPPALLLGPACLDRYVAEGLDLPGGGALNMAYHWARMGFAGHLLSRVGDDHAELFLDFCHRHAIAVSPTIVAHGPSSAIDIVIDEQREPHMDHFVEGVWTGFRLTPGEEDLLRGSRRMHAVLVGPVTDEVDRLAAAGLLDHLELTGDFLSFRRYPIERFAATMQHLSIGVIGWPGAPDAPEIAAVRDVTYDLGRLVVVTLGERGILVLDGRRRADRFVPVRSVPVLGTSVGCGDAFVAGFLATLWSDAPAAGTHPLDALRALDDSVLDRALAVAAAMGAAATGWVRPLPDRAYDVSS